MSIPTQHHRSSTNTSYNITILLLLVVVNCQRNKMCFVFPIPCNANALKNELTFEKMEPLQTIKVDNNRLTVDILPISGSKSFCADVAVVALTTSIHSL